jgi:hypothetical protein
MAPHTPGLTFTLTINPEGGTQALHIEGGAIHQDVPLTQQ